ncbi:MAG: hypothetical protein ACXVCE_15455 [Bacteriovorax sp.]
MKNYLIAILMVLSFNLMATETCYKVSEQGNDLGVLCLEKSLNEVDFGESIEINGTVNNLDIHFRYVRLQNEQYQSCGRPKDRPPVCTLVNNAKLILPKPPLNKVGLPSVPSDITFRLPELTTGEIWGYNLLLINH